MPTGLTHSIRARLTRTIFFFCFCILSTLIFFRKNVRWCVICICQVFDNYDGRKYSTDGLFSPKIKFPAYFFHPEYLENIISNSINPFISPKNNPKTWNQKSYQDQIYFFNNASSPHQNEQFDMNFNFLVS